MARHRFFNCCRKLLAATSIAATASCSIGTAQTLAPTRIATGWSHQIRTAVPAPAPEPMIRKNAAETASIPEPAPEPVLRRLRGGEMTRPLVLQANRIIKENYREPFGTEIPFEIDGRRYVGRIERHFHPIGGEARPWGWHPGCSLFSVEAPKSRS